MKLIRLLMPLLLAFSLPSMAQEHGAKPADAAAEQPPLPVAAAIAIPDNYCANIADKAKDARYLLQAQSLKDLQKKLEDETAKLEAKRVEVEAVLKRRDEEMNKARRELVDIYAKVKPDVAAVQLALLPPETAASVMRQLKPQAASVIMNEMKPEVAAAIATLLAMPPDEAAKVGNKG